MQWLSDCCERVTELGVFGDKTPNHVLVNEYTPGQGIMVYAAWPHVLTSIMTGIVQHRLLQQLSSWLVDVSLSLCTAT